MTTEIEGAMESSPNSFKDESRSGAESDTPLVILPCAGWGKRIGSPQAKELLVHPTEIDPLVSWSLELVKRFNWPVLIVSRKDKTTLNDWVNENSNKYQITLHLVESSKEWPESILACSNHWHRRNLLILPDTRFQQSLMVFDLANDLNHVDISVAAHWVNDPRHWGMIDLNSVELAGCEKPKQWSAPFWSWGLISFRQQVGKELFEKLLDSTLKHRAWKLKATHSVRFLNQFQDLTRGIWKTPAD